MYLENIKEYWDSRAKGYSEKSINELNSEEEKFWEEKLIKLLPKNKKLKCLDIGCGPGFLGIILGKLGHEITFCDYSEKMLEEAKENAIKEELKFAIKKGDAQNLEFESEKFDVIVNRNLVWNLEDPEKAYKEWLRILKKDGKLIIFDGNHYLHKYNEDYLANIQSPNYNNPHTKEYMKGINPKTIESIAEHLPLSKIERPKWDLEFFLKKKVSNIYVEPGYKEFLDKENKKREIIEKFTICIEK